MSDPRKIDRADAIQLLWPLVGPYTADSVVSASAAISDLWRFLAHATLDSSPTENAPSDVYLMVNNLRASAHSAAQVLAQVESWAVRLMGHQGLMHDGDRNDHDRAVSAASAVADWLLRACGDIGTVASDLGKASAPLSHLYIDLDDEDGEQG
ncbi:hypothetical protein [Nocardia sp. NPDC056100]|uniref:hypothetical protein n=1 Tax=Nocardia sp. NPDC056100 TaxID=3345712 RepID=UPI0035D871C0